MNRRQQIVLGIAIPIALGCAVLNIMGDYIQRSNLLKGLMDASITVVIVALAELAQKSRNKDKDSH